MRAELLVEARIIAHAFATNGVADDIEGMARTLSGGACDEDMDRAHARRLAAALKRIAADPEA